MPVLTTTLTKEDTPESTENKETPQESQSTKKRSSRVKYPTIETSLRGNHTPEGPLTVEEAKELIGWTEVEDGDYDLTSNFGKKIVLEGSPTNRPFKRSLADRYANEMLRKKWAFNLESVVLDKYGHVQQGQHRLVGFILAEELRQISPQIWGKTALTWETLIGFGVDDKPATADTFDTGAKRSLSDVVYRHQDFGKDLADSEQKTLSKVLAGAIRLVWIRVGGQQISYAPHFPHSEAMDFYSQHPKILDCVRSIVALDKEKGISSLISLSYAAALMYLMKSAEKAGKTAHQFWTLFSTGEGLSSSDPILALRNKLTRQLASSGRQRDELVSLVIKAWNAWTNEEEMTTKELSLKKSKEGEQFVISEFPRIGGLDTVSKPAISLSTAQRLILSVLRQGRHTYEQLSEKTNLSIGKLSKHLLKVTSRGTENPKSLESLGFVYVQQLEEQPTSFVLSKAGEKYFKAV